MLSLKLADSQIARIRFANSSSSNPRNRSLSSLLFSSDFWSLDLIRAATWDFVDGNGTQADQLVQWDLRFDPLIGTSNYDPFIETWSETYLPVPAKLR